MNKLSLLVACGAILIVMGCGASTDSNNGKGSANDNKSAKSSKDYLDEGNIAFKAKDYKKAIEPYRKAFDLEKQDRKLEKKWWFILLDNLTLAYGITGDLTSSQEIAEYGISKEPTYPLFYYNLADVYGEKNDEANAIKNIRLAYKYKDNLLDGEKIPEPTTDSSFKFLMKNESFKKAVEEAKSGK